MEEAQGGRERRLSPRYEVSLVCSVALPDDERSSGLLFPDASIAGHTRDLSETGIGLVLPSIYAGYDCVVDRGRTLRLRLEIPSGTVELLATAVHYTRSDLAGEGASYAVGLLITEMTDDNHALYAQLLRELETARQTR